MNSTPENEIVQLNDTMKSMLTEIARMKSLSEELEVANKSLTQASEAIRDSSDAVGTAGNGISKITQELVALDPNGLRKRIEDQGARIVGDLKIEIAGLNNKIKLLTILAVISMPLSGGILAYLVLFR